MERNTLNNSFDPKYANVHLIAQELPAPEVDVINNVKWGRCDELFTPAYWKIQYHFQEHNLSSLTFRSGDNILDETVACLLGGYGMKSESGWLAYQKLKSNGSIRPNVEFDEVYDLLRSPMVLRSANVRFRFPRQKALFISEFLNRSDLESIPYTNDLALRNWLTTVRGIGLKTASWITRNWLKSEKVAILDIHLLRAGFLAGFFKTLDLRPSNYFELEEKYLQFCKGINVNSAYLDLLMWGQFKAVNRVVINLLQKR